MTINPSIRIYLNKKENGKTFKIKTGWHFELLTSETLKVFESTENRHKTKNKNGENCII